MNDKVKSIAFKVGLTLLLFAVVMLFIVDFASPEFYILILTAVIDLIFCVAVGISIRRHKDD